MERKLKAGGIGGAIATLVVCVAVWFGAPQPPVGLEGALAVVAGAVVGWFTKSAPAGEDEDGPPEE